MLPEDCKYLLNYNFKDFFFLLSVTTSFILLLLDKGFIDFKVKLYMHLHKLGALLERRVFSDIMHLTYVHISLLRHVRQTYAYAKRINTSESMSIIYVSILCKYLYQFCNSSKN